MMRTTFDLMLADDEDNVQLADGEDSVQPHASRCRGLLFSLILAEKKTVFSLMLANGEDSVQSHVSS